MPETKDTPKAPKYIETTPRDTFKVGIVGASAGLLVAILTFLISQFFIAPLFCRSADSFTVCSNGGSIAYNSAVIIVSIIAVVVFVKISVFRPLLVALAAAVTLWGLQSYIGHLAWLWYALLLMGLFALAYLLYFWLLRIRNFVVALIVLIVSVVLLRLLLIL